MERSAVSPRPWCATMGLLLPLSGPAQEAERGTQKLGLGHIPISNTLGYCGAGQQNGW
jgi:hypothetical protein